MFPLCLSSYRRTGLWCVVIVVINSVVLYFSPCPAPPLTLENIYVAIKAIRDWKEFGRELLNYDIDLLDEIKHLHVSTEAHLKVVVELFLLRKGLYQPSWRRVIHALYESNQYQYVSGIKSYAEPVEGECEWVITII